MKKLNLNIESTEEGDQEQAVPKKALNLGLNLDLLKNKDEGITADIKEKLYDQYDPSSSRRGQDAAQSTASAVTGSKPSFKLNMDGIGGDQETGATPKEQMLSGMGATGITPSGTPGNMGNYGQQRPGMPHMDAMSLTSPSAMSVSEMSSRFRAKMKAGGIPTPLGSDMSRAKFDFSGYDPKKFRK